MDKSVVIKSIAVNGIDINVALAGSGPALVLLHGFPHTWELWTKVIPALSQNHRVIAPDLRGTGDSSRAATGFDVATLSSDIRGLLNALDIEKADVTAIDLGAPIAFYLALTHPELVRRLVLMEAILGDLPRPGAPAGAPPWWFGFHAVPGFAETVVEGHEKEYIGFFLDIGMVGDGLTPRLRERFIDAYRGTESLRTAFEFYRAFPTNARQIDEALAGSRLTVPTLAIGARPIGAGLHTQLDPITDDLAGAVIDCGHIIPLDSPDALLKLMLPFFAGGLHRE